MAAPARARRWLAGLLCCTLFAALQGTLGAWVVPWLAQAEAVQICTPQGMQWVVLDKQAPADETAPALAQPCVWAAAHAAALPAPPAGPRPRAEAAQVPAPNARDWRPFGDPRQVLLMAAMRAPPGSPA